MKQQKTHIALMLSALLIGSAQAATNTTGSLTTPQITRQSAENKTYQAATEVITSQQFTRQAGLNDDSAGTRTGYQAAPSLASTSIIQAPSATTATINCDNAAYASLCTEIDKKISDAINAAPAPAPETQAPGWHDVELTMTTTTYTSRKNVRQYYSSVFELSASCTIVLNGSTFTFAPVINSQLQARNEILTFVWRQADYNASTHNVVLNVDIGWTNKSAAWVAGNNYTVGTAKCFY